MTGSDGVIQSAGSRARPRWIAEAGYSLGAGAISTVFAWIAWGLSPATMSMRWGMGGGDQVLHYGIFSSAAQVFPFVPNPALGFPQAQNLFFAPLFDLWSALFVWVASWFTHDGVLILNSYNLLSFLSVGITAYFFFRMLGLRPMPSVLWGVVFSTLPHHFFQIALGHPFLGNYWAVPLIGILALMITGTGSSTFTRWAAAGATPRRQVLRRLLPIVSLSLLVGLTQSYYFVFGAIILGGLWLFVVVGSLVRRRRLRALLWPTVTLGVLAVVVVLQLALLSLNFADRYEKYFGSRTVGESEIYGGKITLLLLPWDGTGIPLLGRLASKYREGSLIAQTSEGPYSSLIAVVAIVVAMTIILSLLAVGGRWGSSHSRPIVAVLRDRRLNVLLFGFLWSLLFFVLAGLGPVFAFIVSPEIRAWSRISIVVYLFAIAVLALIADQLLKGRKRYIAAAILAILVVVDQGVGVSKSFPLAATADAPTRDFSAQMSDILDPGCGIVQLPLHAFPEAGAVGDMGDYDPFLPYMYADGDLRFSYGAVRGTTAGDFWGSTTSGNFASSVTESRACAILVDTYAYTENPNGWYQLVSTLVDDPAVPDLTSSNGRYILYQLDRD